jgi:hypothetical protein
MSTPLVYVVSLGAQADFVPLALGSLAVAGGGSTSWRGPAGCAPLVKSTPDKSN